MTGHRGAMAVVPDGYDQVARLERMKAEHPRAQVWHVVPYWYGAYPVGRWTWVTGARMDLRLVLDALDRLIALHGTWAATEARWPDWSVWVSPLGTWHAWRDGIRVDGIDAGDLAARIGAVQQAVRW